MNKYLLLRDNKQSGPYTVPEIINIGIKPYDLVWLEGKSAAWRYPSEVEELKAFAPAVEEQPFDRFYKKPQRKQADVPVLSEEPPTGIITDEHNRYKPKSANDSTTTETKKVYINFPASSKPAVKSVSAAPATIENINPGSSLKESSVQPDLIRNVDAVPRFHQEVIKEKKPADRRLIYISAAACLLLATVSGVLYFNYSQQRESLKELSTIVQELENKEKASVQSVPASLVHDEVPADPSSQNTASIIPDINTTAEETAILTTDPPKKVKPSSSNKTPATENKSVVVFEEKQEHAVAKEQPEAEARPALTRENLFKLVTVKPNAYKTGVLGGISNLQFELTNNSDVELHRVAVEIKYLGPEKKVVKTQTVYFENVSPGAQITLDVPKSNRGVSIEYHVTDIKSQVAN